MNVFASIVGNESSDGNDGCGSKSLNCARQRCAAPWRRELDRQKRRSLFFRSFETSEWMNPTILGELTEQHG